MKMPKDKSMQKTMHIGGELNSHLGDILYASDTDAAQSAFMLGEVLARIHNKIMSDSSKINQGKW